MTIWIRIGALLLACAVGLGAFGAHGLKDKLDAYSMAVYEKAVFYHFIHALGILLVALLSAQSLVSAETAMRTSVLLLAGVIIFSGSLYILSMTGMKWLGAITPIGGVCFIAAWMYLALKP